MRGAVKLIIFHFGFLKAVLDGLADFFLLFGQLNDGRFFEDGRWLGFFIGSGILMFGGAFVVGFGFVDIFLD
jgi:hypothetical protein